MASSHTSEIALWLDAQLSKAWLPNLFAALSRDERLHAVESAWHKVRRELAEVGLLYDAGEEGDGYLDQIELEVTALPSIRASGFVFDTGVGRVEKMVGFGEGVIYLMADTPHVAYAPGYTLTDVIRHEYAHAWYWLEPDFVDAPWFRNAFGASYIDYSSPLKAWLIESQIELDPESARFKTEFRKQFVSEYAASLYCEDFAETFMFFLRYRNSLHRFKNRPGVYRKLVAVESAIAHARQELGT